MKILVTSGVVLLAGGLLGADGILIAGCSLRRPTSQAGETAMDTHSTLAVKATSSSESGASSAMLREQAVVRVAGDLKTTVEFADGQYRSGDCSITTPLPKGYPVPTPPGAIELKR